MTQGPAIQALALACLLASPAAAQDPYSRLSAVRFWSLGDVTRVAVETTQEVEYVSERAVSPDRIFFDLQETRPKEGKRGVESLLVNDVRLRQIRIAETQPGITRVVLDLNTAAEFTVSQLRNPYRLVIELRAAALNPQLPPALPAPPKPEAQNPRKLPQSAQSAPSPKLPPPPEAAGPDVVTLAQDRTPAVLASAPPKAVAERTRPTERSNTERVKEPVALAARRDSHGDQSLIRALGLKLQRVVLDPGHGGHDTGTVGRGGLMEKDLVLDIARRLGALIEARLGSDVLYTRTDDVFIALEERTALAVEREADLFLSIHANSSRTRSVAGPETFYLNFTTDEDALDVASRENATYGGSIKDYPNLLQKITLNEKVHESRELAEVIQLSMHTGLMRGRGAKNRGVKKAPFVVLIGAQIPSVLTEIAFLSNPRDEALLKRNDYRQRVAEALFRGVSQYADTLSRYKSASQREIVHPTPVSVPQRP
ncbi:MAG TPA: N-acetylmuramoyl-L-alanine amidase [Bryobacteraceae bacterium]|nr:N-acetylmuramoyl-L-alanine amidase [Bryobacteraceae bacterium]